MTALLVNETRRRFLAHFSSIGLGSTLAPGVLWGEMQAAGVEDITPEMVHSALALSGLEFSPEDEKAIAEGWNNTLENYIELRKIEIPNDVSPPFHFNPIVPGIEPPSRTAIPFRMSTPTVRRPSNIEDLAFASVTELSTLLRNRQVRSVELTEMYLDRLHRFNDRLNCVVTFLDDLAMEQARRADAEIAAGRYRGPLHGVPWGAKDIISVAGYKTTWGSGAYTDQVFDYDASVVEMLRDAGAVLLAKLTTGELAAGDRWFGGQTKNPWNLEQGSSGSSAGPGSATAAGCVGFAIGTETSGSILSPSARCGLSGLRPTLGRISRAGVMALSWTQDRLGPMCRSAEDCALVMSVIARPDGKDMSVVDLPFNWDAQLDIRPLRVGYIADAFAEVEDAAMKRANEAVLDQVRALGFTLVDVKVPEFTTDFSAIGVESSAFHYQLVQTGRDKQLTSPNRGVGMKRSRLVPAVEFLQHQRLRTMMMMELAKATAHVDVYIVPRGTRPTPPPAPPAPAGAAPAAAPAAPAAANDDPPSPMQRHSSMANLATYPAISMPNGFNPDGSPMAINFYARPFGETALLAVAKAWQDRTDHHRKRPALFGAS
jgi:Asp-tRNA(Asn)/Glu-tRNA(Gln) amidotransferase A subunit family amidase